MTVVLNSQFLLQNETDPHGDKKDPNFQYGATSVAVALSVLLATLLVTIISLVLTHRALQPRYFVRNRRDENEDQRRLLGSTSPDEDTENESNETRQPTSIAKAADILVTATATAVDSVEENEQNDGIKVTKC